MNLFAFFHSDDELALNPPYAVFWDDGRKATTQDYIDHIEDTHEYLDIVTGQIVIGIYPDIAGEVRWDDSKKDWYVSGCGIDTFYLQLHDQNVAEVQIIEQLYTFPVVYRCKISSPSSQPGFNESIRPSAKPSWYRRRETIN